jgi:hypothetical protein
LAHSLPAPQAAHAAPPSPHTVLLVPGWQTPFASQQPLGQLAASHKHEPLMHSCPPPHEMQMSPFTPQAPFASPRTQVVPLQQPFGQLFASHWQIPFAHSCPAGQATQAAPFAPHLA